MSLIALLVAVLVLCVVVWGTQRLMTAFALGEPLRTIVTVAIVIICLLWFLSVLGVLPGTVHLYR